MSAKVDQFCDNLRDRLNAAEKRIESVKSNVQAFPKQAENALNKKLDDIRNKVQAQKERVERTRANLKARADQKIAETKAAVNEWKEKREIRKLNARADRAEVYAADAIDLAVAFVDEAEEAILDAVVARMDAETAQSAVPVAS